MTTLARAATVRPLAPTDRSVVEGMTRAARLFRADEIPVALEVFDAATGANPAGAIDPDYEHAGVVCDGCLRGWAVWGPTPGTLGTFDLYWIVVEPLSQGAGFGSLLVEEMERRVRGRARLIMVETAGRDDYAGTRAFYQRHGYHVVATIPDFYAPGDDRVTFVKTL
ncbi:MAG: GNAT family N-acetyltransferase [Gemmatimonadota bacterium]